jgi:hypothetical protein
MDEWELKMRQHGIGDAASWKKRRMRVSQSPFLLSHHVAGLLEAGG